MSIITIDTLQEKIRVLTETLWNNKINRKSINRWLSNFTSDEEKLHALFLLSQFMYYGAQQIRELVKVLYRDHYKYNKVEAIRLLNNNTSNSSFIKNEYNIVLEETRFIGIGNSAESGAHLLYYFRQENKLPKSLFISAEQIIDKSDPNNQKLFLPDVKNYVFIDDFCGSGSQAIEYSNTIIPLIKAIDNSISVEYIVIFCTKQGAKNLSDYAEFDNVEFIYELDESFKCFSDYSRYFSGDLPNNINKGFAETFCIRYGEQLINSIATRGGFTSPELEEYVEQHKLGFGNCQLLIGFEHNTPDNTLPVIWYNEEDLAWYPIFPRYNKIYG